MPATAGQHERELDDRHEQRPATELPRGEQVRGRRPEEDDERHRDEVRLQRDAQGVACDLARQPRAQLAERELGEDRDDREQQEPEGDAGDAQARRRRRTASRPRQAEERGPQLGARPARARR